MNNYNAIKRALPKGGGIIEWAYNVIPLKSEFIYPLIQLKLNNI